MSEVIPNTGGIPEDGSPEGHVEKMAGMTDLNAPAEESAPESTAPARPDNIPEKFWDAEKGEINTEALLKSQADLEKQVRGNQPEETPADAPAQTQDNVVEAASAEWAEKGELTGDTYKALEAVGISKEMTDSYIAGQTAIVSKLQSAAYEPFNGADGYNAAADWAASNLSEAEIQALDVQLTSGNPDIVAQGAKALLDRYSAGADIEPSALRGGGNGAVAGTAYKSSAEMMKDMADPRYRTDSTFRADVADKLSRSNL